MNKLFNHILKVIFPLVIATTIGCSNHLTTKDGTCLTCWNNPITQAPINHDGESKENVAAGEVESVSTSKSTYGVQEHSISFKVPLNVDIAFLKIKREFSYQTEDEIRQEWGSLASTKLKTIDYAYDATPSVYYHMRSAREHDNHRMNIDTTIEKASNSESTIIVKYWPRDASINANAIGVSLKNRILRSLQ